jgi:CspA family cold shock protein
MALFRLAIVPKANFSSGDRWLSIDWQRSGREGADAVQGVVKLYDPVTRDGVIITDVDLAEYELAPSALEGSVFRMLRPGQRVVFDLDAASKATAIRLGSEVDMATPAWIDRDG